MCGISGIWKFNSSPVTHRELKVFTDSIAHRGPDGSDYWINADNSLGLGHRRLSILDLSEAGKQPMSYAGGRYWITFNGEIYNFIELRQQLVREGLSFKTESDTEVILAAYTRWGFDCFNKFNGMWAIGIYDTQQKKLLLCRDRFGVKPLYYTFQPGRLLAFASETIAFKHLEEFELQTDENMLIRSIDNPVMTEGTGHTIWKNVFQLLPGHFMEMDAHTSEIKQHRWFSIPQQHSSISYNEAKEEFFTLLENAVKLRLRSDVPVATALSGGLDSSSVYAMLYHLKSKNLSSERVDYNHIKGFVATFEGTVQDETEYARAMVEHCHGEAEFLRTDFNTIVASIEQSTRLFNDITATPISVLGDVYKSMRQHKYIVSLDGHGVDEMLYGYRSLVGMAVSQAMMSMDDAYEKDLQNTYMAMVHPAFEREERERLGQRTQNLKQLLGVNFATGRLKYTLKRQLKKLAGNRHETFSFGAAVANPYLSAGAVKPVKELSDKPVNLGYYNLAEKELAIDFYYRNIPYNMRDFDRAAMQHGIEIRMPFMDYNLVNFVFSLPMEYKVGHGFTKRIMRDAMGSLLPDKVRKRTLKTGMGAPIHDWFNEQLNEYISDTVSSAKFLQNNLWDGEKIRQEVLAHCKSKNWQLHEAQQFWNILNAHIILS